MKKPGRISEIFIMKDSLCAVNSLNKIDHFSISPSRTAGDRRWDDFSRSSICFKVYHDRRNCQAWYRVIVVNASSLDRLKRLVEKDIMGICVAVKTFLM
jgi:hypothetical protein